MQYKPARLHYTGLGHPSKVEGSVEIGLCPQQTSVSHMWVWESLMAVGRDRVIPARCTPPSMATRVIRRWSYVYIAANALRFVAVQFLPVFPFSSYECICSVNSFTPSLFSLSMAMRNLATPILTGPVCVSRSSRYLHSLRLTRVTSSLLLRLR